MADDPTGPKHDDLGDLCDGGRLMQLGGPVLPRRGQLCVCCQAAQQLIALSDTKHQGGTEVNSNEEIVREAYRLAEGNILDGHGFRALFTEDGTFNDLPNSLTFRGDQIPQALAGLASAFPDIHRELLGVHAIGDVVAVELRIQGTHLGGFPTPAGEIPPTGHRIDVPTADLWYLREGKIETFNCYNAANVWLAQLGANPDFESAIEAAKTVATRG
jgi:hypothetical protein